MAKLKAGDTVRLKDLNELRKDNIVFTDSGEEKIIASVFGSFICPDMHKFFGKTLTIAKVIGDRYIMKECPVKYAFQDWMFTNIEKSDSAELDDKEMFEELFGKDGLLVELLSKRIKDDAYDNAANDSSNACCEESDEEGQAYAYSITSTMDAWRRDNHSVFKSADIFWVKFFEKLEEELNR